MARSIRARSRLWYSPPPRPLAASLARSNSAQSVPGGMTRLSTCATKGASPPASVVSVCPTSWLRSTEFTAHTSAFMASCGLQATRAPAPDVADEHPTQQQKRVATARPPPAPFAGVNLLPMITTTGDAGFAGGVRTCRAVGNHRVLHPSGSGARGWRADQDGMRYRQACAPYVWAISSRRKWEQVVPSASGQLQPPPADPGR